MKEVLDELTKNFTPPFLSEGNMFFKVERQRGYKLYKKD